MKKIENKRKFTDAWFKFLQLQICNHFQNLENNLAKKKILNQKFFWKKNGSKEK